MCAVSSVLIVHILRAHVLSSAYVLSISVAEAGVVLPEPQFGQRCLARYYKVVTKDVASVVKKQKYSVYVYQNQTVSCGIMSQHWLK